MIPTLTYEPDPTIPPEAAFWMPAEEDLDTNEGIGFFRNTWVIAEIARAEAQEMVFEESGIASAVDRLAPNFETFETVAHAIERPEEFGNSFLADVALTGDVEDISYIQDLSVREFPALEGLELGVAGLSYALASIGCYPVASCRSHLHHSWSPNPVVLFATDRLRAEWLWPLVDLTGCGFELDDARPQFLGIAAPSIRQVMALAQIVIERSDA